MKVWNFANLGFYWILGFGVWNLASAYPIPKPAPGPRGEVPAVFTKPVPVSIAELQQIENHVKALTAKVTPAVVAVEVGSGAGSGVIITSDGLVLTAGHVCGRPNRDVTFTFPDGKTARGKTLGMNEDNDTGLLRITDPGPWPHLSIGDLDQQTPGDWVLALGHPGGFDPRRSLVVRLGRIIRIGQHALQTDCTIAPGDSGGPLFDMSGRVIGIHTAIAESLADNFHVPISHFVDSWAQLTKDTTGSHALGTWLGATIADDSKGCRLSVIQKNSPAEKAGLKSGDIIFEVEGRTIAASASLKRWLSESSPGETLRLAVQRDAQKLSM
jgi:serine protease Do